MGDSRLRLRALCWHSLDPAEQFDSPYVYCGNNPANFVELDGAESAYNYYVQMIRIKAQLVLQKMEYEIRLAEDLAKSHIPMYCCQTGPMLGWFEDMDDASEKAEQVAEEEDSESMNGAGSAETQEEPVAPPQSETPSTSGNSPDSQERQADEEINQKQNEVIENDSGNLQLENPGEQENGYSGGGGGGPITIDISALTEGDSLSNGAILFELIKGYDVTEDIDTPAALEAAFHKEGKNNRHASYTAPEIDLSLVKGFIISNLKVQPNSEQDNSHDAITFKNYLNAIVVIDLIQGKQINRKIFDTIFDNAFSSIVDGISGGASYLPRKAASSGATLLKTSNDYRQFREYIREDISNGLDVRHGNIVFWNRLYYDFDRRRENN